MRKNYIGITLASLLVLAIAGCDNKPSDNKTTNAGAQVQGLTDLMPKPTPQADVPAPVHADTTPKPTSADIVPQKVVDDINAPVIAPTPEADKTTPLQSYAMLDSGNQLMFSYLAILGTPIDYPQVLSRYSQDYARSTDEFKKNDILTALKPKIDNEVAKAKTSRYMKLLVSNPIDKFDFAEKGFPVASSVWSDTSYRYFGDNGEYKIGFTNGSSFQFLKPASEDDARKIEALRSKYQPMELVVYFFIQDADPATKTIKAEIVKITLVDKKGATLAIQE